MGDLLTAPGRDAGLRVHRPGRDAAAALNDAQAAGPKSCVGLQLVFDGVFCETVAVVTVGPGLTLTFPPPAQRVQQGGCDWRSSAMSVAPQRLGVDPMAPTDVIQDRFPNAAMSDERIGWMPPERLLPETDFPSSRRSPGLPVWNPAA